MEKLIITKQISYSCIFPNGSIQLEDILTIIPSSSSIAWASYMLTKKNAMTIDQREHDFFFPLLFQMNSELQHTISNYLKLISRDIENYVFIDKVALLTLIEYLLENHNKNTVDVFESKDDFSNMILAYLLCCDEKLRYTTEVLNEKVIGIDSQIAFHLPEKLRYNDIYFNKDYRVEFLRFYYFMIFCEQNQFFNTYLNLFLQEKQIAKWDDYLYFILDTYLTLNAYKEGCTNIIIIDPDSYYSKNYLDSICVDIINFKRSTDFTGIRSKPVYYHGNNKYSILSMNFFIDKMFQSFLFDFALIFKKHKETKIKNYPHLKALVGNIYTENYLFYEIMNGCFARTSRKIFTGKELKIILDDGEPDFYVRKGKNIFLFEFKDVMLNASIKHSENLEQIRHELFQIFETSTIERNTGKPKRKPQAKGITQLLNVIETKLDVIIKKADKIEITDTFNVYPIIVYQDCSFDIEGVRYLISNRFEELIQEATIPEHFSVKQCVMIPIEMLIKLEDYFNDGRLLLDNLIDDYTKKCSKSEQNKLLPFNKFIMRQALNLGYKNNMSSRFKKISDFMINKNTSN